MREETFYVEVNIPVSEHTFNQVFKYLGRTKDLETFLKALSSFLKFATDSQ